MANNKNGNLPKKPKRNKTQIMAAIIAGLLALLMLGSVLFSTLFAKAETLEQKLASIQKKIKETNEKKKNLQDEIKSLSSQKDKVARQIAALDEQIDASEEEINLQTELIENLSLHIINKTVELEESIARQEDQYESARLRIRFMAEQGSLSYLGILLSADSFADFLNRYEAISLISSHDAKVFEDYKQISQEVANQKAELEETKALAEATKVEMEAAKAALEDQLAQKQKAMNEIVSSQNEASEAHKKAIEEAEKLVEEEKKTKAAIAAEQNKTFQGVDGWYWPLSSAHKTITSPYGMRNHSITGIYKLHTGVDIRAASGTKIFASNHGTVVTSAYNVAYGNYVIIDHGGGYMTLYAHMKKRGVSKGDKVKQGDTIGYVGSTGYSTAAHLHFEIIKDGKTFNPLDKFKNTKFTFA